MPMCSTVEYANIRLYSRTCSRRNAAMATEISPMTIIQRPMRAVGDANTMERNRKTAESGTEVFTPESTAHTGEGAWLCASGNHVCMGANPIFEPNPTNTSKKESLKSSGDIVLLCASSDVHVSGALAPVEW